MRARLLVVGTVCLLALRSAGAQTPTAATSAAASGTGIQVKAGDVIPLRLLDTLSSNESAPGEVLHLEVADDVVWGGHVVARRGAPATAEVVRASKHWKRGQGGRASLKLHDVELADGEHLPLDSVYAKGGGGLGKKTYIGVAVASVVLLSPAGTAFLLLNHGEEVAIPAGTAIAGTVGRDQSLESAKFPAADGEASDARTEKAAKDSKKLDKLSLETATGDGSVWISDGYVGEAPLTLDLKPGVYKIRVFRDGYREWKEHVVVDGDPLKLKVSLEKR